MAESLQKCGNKQSQQTLKRQLSTPENHGEKRKWKKWIQYYSYTNMYVLQDT